MELTTQGDITVFVKFPDKQKILQTHDFLGTVSNPYFCIPFLSSPELQGSPFVTPYFL